MRSTRFWLTHVLLPVPLIITAASLCDLTGADMAASDRFYDFAAGSWIYENAWWAKELLHNLGRWLVVLVALVTLGIAVRARRRSRLARWRRPATYALLAMVVGTGTVRLWQETSSRPCARDIVRYGGKVPHVPLFGDGPEGFAAGHCFPSKHASIGFSLTAFYFALLGINRRWALRALGIGVTMGTLFSFGQVVRGAHFVSHNLWSAAVCWTVEAVLYFFVLRRYMPSQGTLVLGKPSDPTG